MIEEKDIGGVKFEFSIEFNENDKREYIEKVFEIQDKMDDVINKFKHKFIVGNNKPILKTEIR